VVPPLKRRLVRKIAFFPPIPPGYVIDDKPGGQSGIYLLTDLESNTLEPLPDLTPVGLTVDAVKLKTLRDTVACAFHFKHTIQDDVRRGPKSPPAPSRRTLLFSHGNSTDIGITFFHMSELAVRLRVDVLAYDYSGYGQSTGAPSEYQLYADIDAAYHYLVEQSGVHPLDIVLYGQSVGSAPSVDLAVRQPVGGVVLHSAMTSGLAALHDVGKTTHWFDVFQNVVKIKKVKCPVFIIHGTEDREVPFDHGDDLYKAAPVKYDPWWVYEGGHNDIEVVWREDFFLRLHLYLSYLDGSPEEASLSLTRAGSLQSSLSTQASATDFMPSVGDDRRPLLEH
jgi:pimeloyl-ACP methyl ester carboxylesterase